MLSHHILRVECIEMLSKSKNGMHYDLTMLDVKA